MSWPEPKTKKDEKDIQARIAQAAREYNEAIAAAKACLESPLFKRYQKSFESTAQNIIDLLLDLPLGDPATFAFHANDLREKLKTMRALGFAVNTAALMLPRKVKPDEKKEPSTEPAA